MPTRLWAVRAQLVTIFATITPPTADFAVFDGPMSRTSPPKSFLLVGTDGGETGGGDEREDGATAEQTLSPMANNWREESGEVVCAAWAWSGETDFVALRTTVKAIADAAETLIQGDRTLGGVLVKPALAEVTALRLREVQTTNGAFVRGAFTVSYSGALITI